MEKKFVKCIVPNCPGLNSSDIIMYRVPENDKEAWSRNLDVDVKALTTHIRVCSRHFRDTDVGSRKLKVGARPMLNLGREDVAQSVLLNHPKIRFRKCCMINCPSTCPPSTLFSLPNDPEKRRQWTDICRIPYESPIKRHICAKHFDKQMLGDTGTKLLKNAMPRAEDPKIFENDLPIMDQLQKNKCKTCIRLCRQVYYYKKRLESKLKDIENLKSKQMNENELQLKKIQSLESEIEMWKKRFEALRKSESLLLQELLSVKANANAVKRGRGRPRKDHLNQNSSQNSFLEEDLQCSTDDEEFQDVSEDENNAASILDQGERIIQGQSNSDNVSVTSGMTDFIDTSHIKKELKVESPQMENEQEEQQQCEDESQQAAEAMLGLAQQQLEDSMDLDPNYDPSDFLTMHNRMNADAVGNIIANNIEQQQQQQQADELQDPYGNEATATAIATTSNTIDNDNSNIRQLPMMTPRGHNRGIDDDLAISDSDEENNGGHGHGHVKVKTEKFNDYGDEEYLPENYEFNQPTTTTPMANPNPAEISYPIDVPKEEPEFQQIQPQNEQQQQPQQQQQHLDDNDDDGWLRF